MPVTGMLYTHTHTHTYIHIQGVTGETDQTSGECSLGQTTWSVRKVSDRIFLCEHLMDYNLARLHEPTL